VRILTKQIWTSARLPEPWYLPTSSYGINRALGGRGLASGRIHVYWGAKACGKTTMALQQIALAQKEGKNCAFLDSERAFSEPWAIRNGVNVDDLLYNKTLVVEEALELMMPAIQKDEIDLLVIDSVNSLNYASFFDDPKSQGMGTYARSSKMLTHKLLSVLGDQQQIILISQASMQKNGQHFNLGASVGSAIEHWASTMIKFRKTGATKPEPGKPATDDWRADGSYKVTWRLEKSKQSNYPVTGNYYFNDKTAQIDNVDEVVTYAKSVGILTGTTWIKYAEGTDEELKWNGRAKLLAYIEENPVFLKELAMRLEDYDLSEDEGEFDEAV
jgi:RecA/RadA recombinase